MRSAERAKVWTAVQKAPRREIQLTSFSFEGIPGLKDGQVVFRSPITAICGINGTGKSSLLRGIWATLKWGDIDKFPEIEERLKHFSAALTFTISNNQVVRELKLDRAAQEELPIAVLHIDPSTVVGRLQRSVCAINDLAEVVESHEPIQLDRDELQLLSFILNKKYDEAAIYEIDDYQEEDPFPVITVKESGVPYDIRTMSLGEISVFTIFWNLHRAQKNSLVLLEEPETFLSPVSQGAFLDYLASVCVQKQLTLVLTTHSPQMFSRLSKDQVRFSYRTDVGAALADESQFDTMRHAVGISSPVDRIILVEDRAARELVVNVLRKTDHSFLLRSEVIDVGGAGEINRICEVFPDGIRSFSMIGLYDGDVQAEVLALKPSWQTVFLPGEKAVEEMFREIIEADPAFVAARLGRSVGDLGVILAKIRGLDHHDWFEEFVKELHVSYPELMSVCFDHWKSDTRNEADVDNFLVDLHRAAVPKKKK